MQDIRYVVLGDLKVSEIHWDRGSEMEDGDGDGDGDGLTEAKATRGGERERRLGGGRIKEKR
jgi:hypothetical protein